MDKIQSNVEEFELLFNNALLITLLPRQRIF